MDTTRKPDKDATDDARQSEDSPLGTANNPGKTAGQPDSSKVCEHCGAVKPTPSRLGGAGPVSVNLGVGQQPGQNSINLSIPSANGQQPNLINLNLVPLNGAQDPNAHTPINLGNNSSGLGDDQRPADSGLSEGGKKPGELVLNFNLNKDGGLQPKSDKDSYPQG